jgi:alpha/beta superfamily hydrolase
MSLREKPFEIIVDGIVVRGRIFIAPDLARRAPAVVILHGIPRSKPTPGDPGYAPMARELAQLGFLSLFLNFRGCGESEGNFHILGWSEDLQSLIDWLRKEYAPRGIALLGFSGGGAVAIYTAARDKRVSAVVSASSPANFDALGADGKLDAWMQGFREIGLIRDPDFPASLPAWLKEFEQVKPIDWVDKIAPRPVLFIHGEKDEIVPLDHARLLFEKAGEPKELFIIKNAPHRLRLEANAIAKAKDWLAAWKNTLAK